MSSIVRKAKTKTRGCHNGCDIHSHLYLWVYLAEYPSIWVSAYLCGMACKSQDLRLSTMLFIALSRFVAARSGCRCFCIPGAVFFLYIYIFKGTGAGGRWPPDCVDAHSAELLKTLRKILGKDTNARNVQPTRCAGISVIFSLIYSDYFSWLRAFL